MGYRMNTSQRFWSKVEITTEDGCWLWIAGTTNGGYGVFGIDGLAFVAHRWAYEQMVGPIPKGLHLDHLCRVRACVNPAHLEPVTPGENSRRARDTPTCAKGHSWTPENTYWYRGYRLCRGCRRAADRRRLDREHAEMRARKENRKTCAHGHPWTPENLYQEPHKRYKTCRLCARERVRVYRRRLAAQSD